MRKSPPSKSLLLFLLALPKLANALELRFKEIGHGVYAFIGEMGNRTYQNEGLNANVGFIVTTEGVVVIDSGATYRFAQQIHAATHRVTKWCGCRNRAFFSAAIWCTRIACSAYYHSAAAKIGWLHSRPWKNSHQSASSLAMVKSAISRANDTLDQSRFKSLLNYDSLKSGNASRIYLEMEAE